MDMDWETHLKEDSIPNVKEEEETVDSSSRLDDVDMKTHEEVLVTTNTNGEEDIHVKEEAVDEHEVNFQVREEEDYLLQDIKDDIEIKEEEVTSDPESGPTLEIDHLSLSPIKKERIVLENHVERKEVDGNEDDNEPPPLANDVDEVAASEFVRKMKSTFVKYSPYAIFNAVKIKLCMKKLQSSLLKNAGEKMAFILCANASGDFKLRPACVVKEEHNTIPSEDINSLPVWFAATENGEIDDVIFIQWYSKEFIPKVSEYLRKKSLPLKVLLLLDDSYAHLADAFQMHGPNFKVVFFPPRTASLIQPLTQPEFIQEFTEALKRNSELFRSSSTPHADKSDINIENKNSSAAKPSPEISSEDCTCNDNTKKRKYNQRSIADYFKK